CHHCVVTLIFFVFFFQAEDGIRDFHVTGVQTCALPILILFGTRYTARGAMPSITSSKLSKSTLTNLRSFILGSGWSGWPLKSPRSEERRVGKGCGCRRSPYA